MVVFTIQPNPYKDGKIVFGHFRIFCRKKTKKGKLYFPEYSDCDIISSSTVHLMEDEVLYNTKGKERNTD
jgi:hypothetical protein